MTIADRLRTARDLVADPGRWTRNAEARNAEGKATPPQAKDAVCWCAIGAIYATPGWSKFNARTLLTRSAWILYNHSPEYVNDFINHAAVLEMYNYAIGMAESNGR